MLNEIIELGKANPDTLCEADLYLVMIAQRDGKGIHGNGKENLLETQKNLNEETSEILNCYNLHPYLTKQS